jgi:hypothetical protein
MRKLSEKQIKEIRKDPDNQNWWIISRDYEFSEEFIREFKDYINWWSASVAQNFSESLIREFQDKVDWDCIFSNQNLSEAFMIEFIHKMGSIKFLKDNKKIPKDVKDKLRAMKALMGS